MELITSVAIYLPIGTLFYLFTPQYIAIVRLNCVQMEELAESWDLHIYVNVLMATLD